MSQALKITAPKSTLQTAPIRDVMHFAQCIITRGTVYFPKGHVGLTGLWVEYQGKQVFPQNHEHVYRGDNIEIEIYPNLPVMEPPYELEVHLFNEDDTYEHSCYLSFDVLLASADDFPSETSLSDLNRYFSGG